MPYCFCQALAGTFYSEVQHGNKETGHLELGKIVSKRSLTINNLITNMPYKHFTLTQRNALAALLKAGIKKKDIARQLRRDRTTIWQARKKRCGSQR